MTVKCGDSNRKCLARSVRHWLINAILILATSSQLAGSLRFTSIQMPALVQRGTNFWLSCQYELTKSALLVTSDTTGRGTIGSGEQLYSVKWYRNNEEFYRLILSGQQQQQQHLESQSNGPPPPHQQQYFSQAGVNVLMSASNATHVRLLNASLESDGSYACEISTQNLSTIRHEKEIKVYVLPHLKLNLIGLRSLYSLGERVELNCLSDFSRPAGALGWFINGQQISASTNSQHFELAAGTRHKSSEPKLSRASLALKFKLTNELLRALAASTEQLHTAPVRPGSHGAGNQSKLLLMKTAARQFVNGVGGGETANGSSGAQLFELLKLECRFKLTDVSDVTFNELRVAAAAAASSTSGAAAATGHTRPRQTGSDSDHRGIVSSEPPDLDEENLRRRRHASNVLVAPELELTKSHGTQVSQSVCPARRADLLATVRVTSSPTTTACHLGMLAREDPVIVEPEVETTDQELSEQNLSPSSSTGNPLELPLGYTLSVNCSTLGALDLTQQSQQQQQHQSPANNQRHLLRAHTTMSARLVNSRWPIITTGGDNDDQPTTSRAGVYCSDPGARKRLLVSGRTQTLWRVQPVAEESQQQRRHHVAYVNLAGSSSAVRKQQQQQQLAPPDDKLSLSLAHDKRTADGERQRKSLVAGQLHHAAAAAAALGQDEDEEEWQEEGPPPLLEWFINNQEAPRSSAHYTPELPLLTTSVANKQLDLRPRGGATSDEFSHAAPPSIDYVEYFANFNRQRPVDQSLMLQLTLDKRHFMTPDSLLKLRCSSTQAQVLASDSLSVSLMVLPQGGGGGTPTSLTVQQNLEQQQQQQQLGAMGGQVAGAHWNQRPPSSGGGGGGGTTRRTQIESKYLHQYPRSSSSSQARQRAHAEQRHLAAGGQQPVGQSPGRLASASESSSGGQSNQRLASIAPAYLSCLIISLVAQILQVAALL